MSILVTGAAGFIGYHTAEALLARGEQVVGIDNLNPYYDPRYKTARLERLQARPGFSFTQLDIADREPVEALFAANPEIDRIVHLAAQAGVRYSLIDPYAYIRSNLLGQIVLLEAARRQERMRHFVYASSSSVYGGNDKIPFSVDDRTDRPLSLYGATKKADELFHYAYGHLYRLPATGLRFFTVYGPWGRPDMAAFLFTKALMDGAPIKLFNNGEMKRDFTFIDDIVRGVIAALDRPPADDGGEPPHRVYNLGNRRSEDLRHFVSILERTTNRKADLHLEPMQQGDVHETLAEITASERDLGFSPATSIEEGLPRFVDWYRSFHGV